MKKRLYLLIAIFGISLISCNCDTNKEKTMEEKIVVTDEQQDYLGITNKEHLSAASKRALKWPMDLGNDWYFEYKVEDLKGDLAYEEGVVRRDPSAMIMHDGKYYMWYSRSTGLSQGFGGNIAEDKVFPWDRCDIWYATSKDGITWKEEGVAVERGEKGAYDDRSVFTVEIMVNEGVYYLCYQTVKDPYNVRVKNQVGLAWSNSPNGPWTKSKEPILSPANNGVWKGEEQNRFLVEKKGDFDSHKVHDPCIIPFKGKFYLYYKGEQMGEQVTFGGRQIRHGVAIADNPKGPYVKSPFNPISNSGHEICVWPYNGGIASLITTDGPERNTVQWSPDGINFEIMGAVKGAPHAIGLNRTADNEKNPTEILRWGLTHEYKSWDWQYIRRFTTWNVKNHTAKGEDGE
ncbi:glycoside hydrolase family 117 protein [Lutibacter citreus]|uniref:glycoside hydrolase family 117 protein n=1 Tax=Lutibacter citreus TaxID=2138210 RepID=UPI000DBEA191|nr:family 43 glycosylhydrolase [Lutibacter citreus]